MSFVGGKLSLKGGEPLKSAGGVKKKKKKSKPPADEGGGGDGKGGEGGSGAKASLAGTPLAPPAEGEDRRTEAQKRHDAKVAKLEEERLRKMATKGYRERVKDSNEHLASLSEHHDSPKVGPG